MPDTPLQKTDLSLSAPAFLRTESAARCRAPPRRKEEAAESPPLPPWRTGNGPKARSLPPTGRSLRSRRSRKQRRRWPGTVHEAPGTKAVVPGKSPEGGGDSHSAEAGKNVVSPPTAHRKFRPCTRTAGGPPRRAAGLTARSSVCFRPPAPHPKPDEKRPSARTVFGKPQANREFTGRQPQREYAPPGPCGCAIFAARPLAAAPVFVRSYPASPFRTHRNSAPPRSRRHILRAPRRHIACGPNRRPCRKRRLTVKNRPDKTARTPQASSAGRGAIRKEGVSGTIPRGTPLSLILTPVRYGRAN